MGDAVGGRKQQTFPPVNAFISVFGEQRNQVGWDRDIAHTGVRLGGADDGAAARSGDSLTCPTVRVPVAVANWQR